MTFIGRQRLVEDDLRWKTTLDGRQPFVEEDLQWKTPFSGRRPLVEDNLQWKTTFHERWPFVESNSWWKTTLQHFFFYESLKNQKWLPGDATCLRADPPPSVTFQRILFYVLQKQKWLEYLGGIRWHCVTILNFHGKKAYQRVINDQNPTTGNRKQWVARLWYLKYFKTKTYRDFWSFRMFRPRLNEPQKFGGCRDGDSSRLKIFENVETRTHQDS